MPNRLLNVLRPWRVAAASFAAAFVVAGCVQLREPATSKAEPEATAGADTAPDETGALLEPAPTCPADLSIDAGERKVDIRRAPSTSNAAEYHSRRFVPEHNKDVTEAFFVEPDEAVKRVIELEARKPSLVPAGFRDLVAKTPRDPKLRWTMARCELQNKATARRASYDAAMAVLLGMPPARAAAVFSDSIYDKHPDGAGIISCTRGEKGNAKAPAKSCPEGQSCLWDSEQCTTAIQVVSNEELQIEDALSRAVSRVYLKSRDKALLTFVVSHVHQCSKMTCQLGRSVSDGLVQFDVRDGVFHDNRPGVGGGVDPYAKQNARCREYTGVESAAHCHQMCWAAGSSVKPGCDVRCDVYCK